MSNYTMWVIFLVLGLLITYGWWGILAIRQRRTLFIKEQPVSSQLESLVFLVSMTPDGVLTITEPRLRELLRSGQSMDAALVQFKREWVKSLQEEEDSPKK